MTFVGYSSCLNYPANDIKNNSILFRNKKVCEYLFKIKKNINKKEIKLFYLLIFNILVFVLILKPLSKILKKSAHITYNKMYNII